MIPAAALLPLAGAAIGGITGYRRSGGDLGAAALGAGLGAATPGAFRMAGTALGGLGAGALSKTALGKLMQQQTARTGSSLLTQIPQAAGLVGGGVGLLATPALAGSPAAALATPARSAAGGAAGLAIPAMQPGQAVYDAGGAVPTNVPVGASPYNTLDITNPAGPFGAGRTAQLLEADIQLANIRKLMPELFKAAEARSKTEFQRQMAAAGIRQNIATAANMLERSQQAAQQMGLNAASQMGSALTSQYQYQ